MSIVVVDRSILADHATVVAPRLLNKILLRDDGRAVRIVEVEAYGGAEDGASHARGGPTARCAPMFGPPGHLYRYLIYGMHHCANVVTGPDADGQAVLIRAGEAVAGLDALRLARPRARRDVDLANGPAKLCEAMSIGPTLDGADLCDPSGPLRLVDDGTAPPRRPGRSTRIGITRDTARRWRWYVPGDPCVSGRSPS